MIPSYAMLPSHVFLLQTLGELPYYIMLNTHLLTFTDENKGNQQQFGKTHKDILKRVADIIKMILYI